MIRNKVQVFSHFFTVTKPELELRKILYYIAGDYTVFGMVYDTHIKKKVWKPIKTFGFNVPKVDEFRFHIGQLEQVITSAQRAMVELDIERVPLYTPHEVDLKINPKFVLRDDQEEAYRFLVQDDNIDFHTPLLSMPMGSGKTATSLVSVARIGQRFTVTVIAGYVEKWVNDILEVLILGDKDVMRVEGNKSLINYCHHVLDNQATPEKLPAATVISLNTIRSWQNAYLEDPNDPTLEVYGMKPWELHEKAGAGVNIFDEIHQHLHSVYRMFCFMHVPKTISLSATFTSQDQTELRIQRMMFPREKRFEEIKMRKYISVYACQYQIKDFKMSGIQTTARGSTNYSHVAFEASILAKADLKHQYIDMILRMANETFIKSRQHGDKCAIFVSSHAMAKEVCKAIVKKYPNLDTRTYLEYDPLENLMDSDIRVTTVLSGGTAHDIRGLTVSIQTISLNSIKSNLQVLGRLREIANRHCKFYYLYCASIPKQVEYQKNKIDIFKDCCKEHVDLMLDPIVPNINSAKSFASRFNPWS